MSKQVVWGIAGLLVGAAVGAGVVWVVDPRRPADETASGSKQPGQAVNPGEEADPVVAALDANAFFEQIMGEDAKTASYSIGGLGLAHYSLGEAVWDADPIGEEVLQERVDAALKAPIRAVGAKPLSEKVSAGVIQTASHKLYTFVCFYEARIGGRLQDRQATAWVAVPVQGRQYSACFRYGR